MKPLLHAWSADKGIELYDMAECESSQRRDILNSGAHAFSLIAVEEFGRQHPIPIIPAKPEQVATICYTSVSSQCSRLMRTSSLVGSGHHRESEGCVADSWEHGLRRRLQHVRCTLHSWWCTHELPSPCSYLCRTSSSLSVRSQISTSRHRILDARSY